MTFVDSKASVIQIDDAAGTLRTLQCYIDSVDGLPGARDLDDVTTLCDTGHKFIPSIQNGKFSISGNYDSTATLGPHVVLSGLALTATATASVVYGPEGTTAALPKITCEAWCTGYVITSKVGSQVAFKADFQIDGIVTVGVYP